MSKTAKTAVGGMMAALSVVLLVPTVLDVFVYVLPAFAGVITMFCVIEMGKTWAFGVYAATAIITMLVIPNKEAAVLYTAFFGYYPIVKAIFESKLPKPLGYLLKFAVFNAAVAVSYLLLVKVFGMPFNELMGIDPDAWWSRFAIPIMLAVGNLVFILFDFMLTRLVTVYLAVWQKKFHKMFRFK
ncbi:MAG: hypothetical protein ACI4SB_04340 [Acutalibacteraceae bacterium]